jgi:hypothetical protein
MHLTLNDIKYLKEQGYKGSYLDVNDHLKKYDDGGVTDYISGKKRFTDREILEFYNNPQYSSEFKDIPDDIKISTYRKYREVPYSKGREFATNNMFKKYGNPKVVLDEYDRSYYDEGSNSIHTSPFRLNTDVIPEMSHAARHTGNKFYDEVVGLERAILGEGVYDTPLMEENIAHRKIQPIIKKEFNDTITMYNKYNVPKERLINPYDQELNKLDVDKPNVNIKVLQRWLKNRGYELPISTLKDGSLDGIYGKETKSALKDWQTKHKTNET